ncbi:MAG: leucyl/phenylalanyl-tRNA--protein transferase [Pseudomonadota bacterium]
MRGFGVEELLACYARGVFPMAEARDDPRIFLLNPDERGVIPLDAFHIPRSLARAVKRETFDITVNQSFEDVVAACAEPAPGRDETWINEPIERLYREMHAQGHAHSIEARRDGRLVGGLYGVTLGGAFFGESMFSLEADASKVALVHLVARLKAGRFALLDTQFITSHLERFGAVTVERRAYLRTLTAAIGVEADFFAMAQGQSGRQILQSITQTS